MNHLLYNLNAKIKNISPVSIGSGANDNSDKDILIDKNGLPVIPATSVIGVVRAYLSEAGSYYQQLITKYFGSDDGNNPQQSKIVCDDLHPDDAQGNNIVIRDGIKIDSAKGIVEEKKKYDYETTDAGVNFNLNMKFYADFRDKDEIESIISAIVSGFKEKRIRLGAKTNSGFGKMEIFNEQLTSFDFSRKKDVAAYLLNKPGTPVNVKSNITTELLSDTFCLKASFELKTSLLVKSYPTDPEMPDAVNIKSAGNHVLPGTSLKGAIRGRSERILNTIWDDDNLQEEFLNNLFGYVKEEKIKTNSKISRNSAKGRINVEETILPAFTEYLQNRIKIDRFTGGVMETALFDSVPLFPNSNINLTDQLINIAITIKKCNSAEAGLILLVLKDLWDGDLPVGGEKNVGRGVMKGKKAEIMYEGKKINFEDISSGLNPDDIKFLDDCVKSLNERRKQ